MVAVLGDTPFLSLADVTPTRTRIAFHTHLVQIPQVYLFVTQPSAEPLHERRTKLLILTIRPWLGNFQPETALPKPSLHRAIADLYPERLSHIAVELTACPVHLARLFGLLDYLLQTGVRLGRDLPRTATSRLIEQPVNARLVEPIDPVVDRAFGNGEQLRDDGAGHTE